MPVLLQDEVPGDAPLGRHGPSGIARGEEQRRQGSDDLEGDRLQVHRVTDHGLAGAAIDHPWDGGDQEGLQGRALITPGETERLDQKEVAGHRQVRPDAGRDA